MDPIFTEAAKFLGPSSIFLFMLWKLWVKYTTDIEKIMSRYETIVTENTKVQTLVVAALERLAEKSDAQGA